MKIGDLCPVSMAGTSEFWSWTSWFIDTELVTQTCHLCTSLS